MRFSSPSIAAVLLPLALIGCSPSSAKPADDAAHQRRGPLKDVTLLFERGKLYSQAGDFTRAEQYFASALANGGKAKAILPHLLKACVASGDLRLASEYAEQELSRNPENARLRFLTGAIYASIGDRSTARSHLVQAASDLPKDAEVQFMVAAFFRDNLNDKVVADPYFREYLKLAPKGEHAEEARASVMERVQ
jgi:tetratricopeptide (TPR) repeat protein